ncbi:hypothetical protein [Bradyrhizobium viridifuturi]|uniref:hypothetical protein n=1 Tax=Bradyrhizobium viridifuturi TaxID=1654716 RepID=UPI000FE1481B|nr:hypothetical protein [Bradyrhizobium viridifuturi]
MLSSDVRLIPVHCARSNRVHFLGLRQTDSNFRRAAVFSGIRRTGGSDLFIESEPADELAELGEIERPRRLASRGAFRHQRCWMSLPSNGGRVTYP